MTDEQRPLSAKALRAWCKKQAVACPAYAEHLAALAALCDEREQLRGIVYDLVPWAVQSSTPEDSPDFDRDARARDKAIKAAYGYLASEPKR